MSHLSTLQLSEMAGITKRQIQRLLIKGAIPGAERTAGGHWKIPDSRKLRAWAQGFERWGGKSRASVLTMGKWAWKNQLKRIGASARTEAKAAAADAPSGPNMKDDGCDIIVDDTDDLAREIRRLHRVAEQKVKAAKSSIEDACEARDKAASMVETGYSRAGSTIRFAKWWLSEKLPEGWGTKYMTTARSLGRWDRSALQRFGILDRAKRDAQHSFRRSNDYSSTQWFKLAGRINAVLRPEKLRKMDSIEKHMTLSCLLPIVAIYNQLKA